MLQNNKDDFISQNFVRQEIVVITQKLQSKKEKTLKMDEVCKEQLILLFYSLQEDLG